MDRLGWVAVVAMTVFTALLVESPAAHAQAPSEELARRAFDEGVALEEEGDYAGALEKFEASARLKRTLGNRFHTAYCLEMLGELVAALAEYEGVEGDARAQERADVVEATRARLEPLRERVPRLALQMASRPPGLEVLLDETPVSPARLERGPLQLDPGEHTIRAQAPDHASFTTTITAREGEVVTVEIDLARAPAVAAEALATGEPGERAGAPSRAVALAVTGGAVALLAGGVASFVAAGSAQRDAREGCRVKLDCDSERSTVRTFDALALGGFVGGAGLAALSVVLWTSKPGGQASAPSRLVARPSWIGLEGSF